MTYTYAAPSLGLLEHAELLKQGAEAKVFALGSLLPTPEVYYPPSSPASSSTNRSSSAPAPSPTPPTPVILKHRFPKTYRHPTLDTQLTRTRLQFEARALARCARAGVTAPRVLNMMVRLTPSASAAYEVVLIDFGLASTAAMPEHYAVDLYVLERAFASTHPASEGLYAGVLDAYAAGLGEKKWKPIETKLKDVRLRGRKRDMTG
ncbi:serine/threonine-protein kinase bud32 [Vanrija albida]|uniref:non-specific serine/threonine protein kinase n=1 Tax=Vanrija albida TaxID=181172 RepID=A0ABR3QBZ2_9TREE